MFFFYKHDLTINLLKKPFIYITLFVIIATIPLCLVGCSGTIGQPKIATAGDVSAFIWGDETSFEVTLTPSSTAIAGEVYTVDLYEKGKYRDSTEVSWNQPEINVYTPKTVHFPTPLSKEESDAYFMKDLSGIFSVIIHESSNNESPITNSQTQPIIINPTTSVTNISLNARTDILTTAETPVINNVSKISPVQTQMITISGNGFGDLDPYNGNSPYIEITDSTSGWSAGYSSGATPNGVTLNIASWSDSQIVISGFTGKYGDFSLAAGDSISINVWNVPSKTGPASYTVACGSISSKSETPVINNVSKISPVQTQTITISGNGFGDLDPYNGNSPYIEITDSTSGWSAGYSSGATPNGVTLNIASWSDSQIVISGFTGKYGDFSLAAGDSISINVWNVPSKTGPASYTVACGSISSKSETPVINNVSKISPVQTQTITISGNGFGDLDPYNGNSPYIEITDSTSGWSAGYSSGATPNGVTLNIASWSDSQIVISGFTGKYGDFSLAAGDSISINVWNVPSKMGPASYTVACGS